MNYETLLERLAELEHEQWMEWSKTMAKEENISQDRLARWIPFWKPYKDLSPEIQEQDRKWARKTLVIFEDELRKSRKSGE